MAADIRIARQGGGKIGMPEVSLGVLPGTGGTQRLARLVGKARAIELMATGALFSFEEAAAIGLVNHVWGESDLKGRSFADAVLDYARQFTPPHRRARPSATSSARCSRGWRWLSRRPGVGARAAAAAVRVRRCAGRHCGQSRETQAGVQRGVVRRMAKTIAVLGAGTMGHGIAHAAMAAGYSTRLYDISQTAVNMAVGQVMSILKKASTLASTLRTTATPRSTGSRHDQHCRRRGEGRCHHRGGAGEDRAQDRAALGRRGLRAG